MIVSDYRNNELLRNSFIRLANHVFGIDFEPWYRRGGWDENYVCHSIVIDSEVVSNVSVNKMSLTVDGVNLKAIQIGTVMTHPDYRSNGFSKTLMEHVLEKYRNECDVFYLFANDSVHGFYPRFGFTPFVESSFSLKVAPLSSVSDGLRKVDCDDEEDMELLLSILRTRVPVSNRFGISGNEGIFLFYAWSVFQDSIYYSEEEEAIVVYRNEGDVLHLYDVASRHSVDFKSLLISIVGPGTETVRFYFTPDRFTHQAIEEPTSYGDLLFIKSKTELVFSFAFCAPMLSHA